MAAPDADGLVPFEQKGAEGERLAAAPSKEELSAGWWYFGNRLCPYANRVWWAMEEKGVSPTRYVHVDLGAFPRRTSA